MYACKLEHIVINVGKMSSRFTYFGKIFAYELMSRKILVVPNRASNIL